MNTTPILPTPDEYAAFTRLDFGLFIERVFHELNPTTHYCDNFHIQLMAMELEAMRLGEMTRLAFNIPPRSMKSIVVSVAYVAWLLGKEPATKIICVSYGQELADALARQCRQVMQSQWYLELFRKTRLLATRLAVNSFETTAGGFRIATSVGGVITGLGADYVILDDPMKPQEAQSDAERGAANLWFRHTLITRLNDKLRGRIVMVMQRLHQDDMTGFVQELEDWKVIALPAIAPAPEDYVIKTAFGTWTHHRDEGEALHPERESLETLEKYRKSQGPEHFAAQFQQAPVQPGGNMIKIDQFQRFDLNAPPQFERFVHSWDTASKATELSGYSVCTVWGVFKRNMYLISVVRARMEYPELRATALALSRGQHDRNPKPDVLLIEDKASGQSLIQDLKSERIQNITAEKPETDKIMRMSAQTALIANGHVYIPHEAPWLAAFLHEVLAFPRGRYSDQVDSLSQALKWLNAYPNEPAILTFYREECERRHAARTGTNDENRIVTVRFAGDSQMLYTRSASVVTVDRDGLYRMKWCDWLDIRARPGWSLVEEAA